MDSILKGNIKAEVQKIIDILKKYKGVVLICVLIYIAYTWLFSEDY